MIDSLVPLLEKSDIIIDGGNSKWTDTIRREKELKEKGLRFIGSGVSGGEEGARFGLSGMPGGDPAAYRHREPIWNAISAKVDPETGREIEGAQPGKPITCGAPCSAYIGPNGAGHSVKMVHNGIEYGDMQMICEAYALMKNLLGMSAPKMGKVFAKWNRGMLDSFLIKITADILNQKDPVTGKAFVDVVLDTAGQKGMGKWTSVNALDMGTPAPTVAEAVFARFISAVKSERVAASRVLKGPKPKLKGDPKNPSRQSTLPFIAQRSVLTPRVSSSCVMLRRNTTGNSISRVSPRYGAVVASSGPSSSRRSPRLTRGNLS